MGSFTWRHPLLSSCQLALILKSPGSISSKSGKETRMKLKRTCLEKEIQSLTAWEGFKVVRWNVRHFCSVISLYLRHLRASSLPPPQPFTHSLSGPETPVNKPKRHYRADGSVESTQVMLCHYLPTPVSITVCKAINITHQSNSWMKPFRFLKSSL